MGDDLDVNLILYKLNKYQTKLAKGEGNLDLYKQKIYFYSEQLGGGCFRWKWTEKDRTQFINTINTFQTHYPEGTHPQEYTLLENLKYIKNTKTLCQMWQKVFNVLNQKPINQEEITKINNKIQLINKL